MTNRLRSAMLAGLVLACTAQTSAPPTPVAHAHHAVSTANDDAQATFDRGLAMLYAFNVGEARTLFARTAHLDPTCAMASWGTALAETIDINSPQTDDGDARGATAIAQARAHAASASAEERALIDALAFRYTKGGTAGDRFRTYAQAMQQVAARYPADPDALVLAAYAEWNAVGALLDAAGQPVAGARTMQRELDDALAIDPANLGAHHLRIHLDEQTNRPRQALADAQFFDRLTFVPGMSHLAHMAGHIYTRIGDYDALVVSSQRALANDAVYFALGDGDGQAYMRRYHDHDLDFDAYGLTTLGRDADARAAVAKEDAAMKLRVALRTRDPSAVELGAAEGNAPARAIALARAGRTPAADALVRSFAKRGDDATRAADAIAVAVVARAEGNLARAADSYRVALQLAGADPGDPKTDWPTPPGEGLGAVLLQQQRFADAERTFRGELARYPNDPRLAFGLAEALRAQGKDDASERAVVAREWHGAAPLTVGALG